MCMLDLFMTHKYHIGVAHLNHNLRADESDQDQQFLKDYCHKNGIPFYLYSIDPSIFQTNNMHEVARNERYRFLNKIKDENGYTHICTAHHLDDSIESFLINFSRGSGLNGLSGIQSDKEMYLRPIIDYSRAEIEDYVSKNEVPYREDSSNASSKYIRNKIRHDVITVLKEAFPSFSQSAGMSIQNLKDSNLLLNEFIARWSAEQCTNMNNEYRIPKTAIKEHKGNISLLHSLIHDFGFNRTQVMDIITSMDSIGSIFYSTDNELLIDRQNLIIRSISTTKKQMTLHTEVVMEFSISKDPYVEIINAQKLEFPLKVKSISPGEKMQPLGMKGLSKKISDILIDKKINRFDKENVKMVYSGETPVWLIGITIDERFKVEKDCKSMLKLEFRTKH